MIPSEILLYRIFILLSVIIYFIFDYFERRRIKDEREEFIRLKTLEMVQKLTVGTLSLFAVLLWGNPGMPAAYPILALILAFMYGEIGGKIYFRRKY